MNILRFHFGNFGYGLFLLKSQAKKLIEFEPKSDMNSFEIHGKVRYFTTSN